MLILINCSSSKSLDDASSTEEFQIIIQLRLLTCSNFSSIKEIMFISGLEVGLSRHSAKDATVEKYGHEDEEESSFDLGKS